jgi:hypothetical protein
MKKISISNQIYNLSNKDFTELEEVNKKTSENPEDLKKKIEEIKANYKPMFAVEYSL